VHSDGIRVCHSARGDDVGVRSVDGAEFDLLVVVTVILLEDNADDLSVCLLPELCRFAQIFVEFFGHFGWKRFVIDLGVIHIHGELERSAL